MKTVRIFAYGFIIALSLVVAYNIGMYAARCVVEAELTESVAPIEYFDVSELEEWGGCGGNGTIRMTGAVVYKEAGNSTFVIDGSGEVWELENQFFELNDFLLLWIADSHTEEVEDDCVIKVWVEHYEVLG